MLAGYADRLPRRSVMICCDLARAARNAESLPPDLADLESLPTGAEEIVLARRVWPDGRTRAYVCGRSATVGDLRELGGALVAFYGQHELRKLMLSTVQLDVLDGLCGAEVASIVTPKVCANTVLFSRREVLLPPTIGAPARETWT